MTLPVPDISVCICTYRRPQLLDRLLAALAEQRLDGRLEVVVVDNDRHGTARDTVSARAADYPWPLAYHLQPQQNIALTRNLAVAEAHGHWIAFIDDDEVPAEDWLARLLETQRACDADAVFAPVLPRLHAAAPDWIRRGGFFDRPRHPTGTPVPEDEARTGNVLIRRARLLAQDGPFDPAYGLSGGEDTMLFSALLRQGARFVWCDEAGVWEEVPPERTNLGWLLRRSYRIGQSYARSLLARRAERRASTALGLALRATAQWLAASLLFLLLLPAGRARAVPWLRKSVAQLGKLSALAGHRYLEYHRP